MTVETAPPPSRARPARPSSVRAAAGRPWPAAVRRCVLVPLIVLIPLVALTPSADHRFNVYANGGRYAARPWQMVVTAVESVPQFLRLGNFRPLGRIVEWSLDLLAFGLTGLLGVPANIALRLVSFAAAIVLTLAAVVFAEAVTARGRLFASTPSVLVATVPFAVGMGFVAAGRTSTTVLFGGLYFLSAALVLGVAAFVCRVTRLNWPRALLIVLAGAALASFNELAALALPLTTVAVVVRERVVLGGNGWKRPGFNAAVLLWLGFLPVFLPVRAIIYSICAHGVCYTGSDVALPGAPAALPNRLVAWLPPLMWHRAADGTHLRLVGVLPALALLALAVLAWRATRQLPRLATLDRRQSFGLAAVAGVALVLGAVLSALNSDLQQLARQGIWGQGWRESGLTGAAGGILVAALVAGRCRTWAAATLVPLVVAGTIAVAANKAVHDGSSAGSYPYLHDRIAQEIADFDRTPAGDARRCALRALFIKTSIANHHGSLDQPELERIDVSLNRATQQLDGRRFCGQAPR
ncbi:MAG TPA: hypothetical protein VGD29_03555 [Actinoplanes sp.]